MRWQCILPPDGSCKTYPMPINRKSLGLSKGTQPIFTLICNYFYLSGDWLEHRWGIVGAIPFPTDCVLSCRSVNLDPAELRTTSVWCRRPNSCQVMIGVVTQYQPYLGEQHWKAIYHVMRYLQGITGYVLCSAARIWFWKHIHIPIREAIWILEIWHPNMFFLFKQWRHIVDRQEADNSASILTSTRL